MGASIFPNFNIFTFAVLFQYDLRPAPGIWTVWHQYISNKLEYTTDICTFCNNLYIYDKIKLNMNLI